MTSGFGRLNPIAETPAEFTPEWVTAALVQGGVRARVTGVETEAVGIGQIGACYRLHLRHDGGAPDKVIVKTAAGTQEQRTKVKSGYRTEVGFYTKLAHIAKIRRPHYWHAAISEDACAFTLLLEDAFPAKAGSQQEGCDLTQAKAALRNLAGLHAPFWDNQALAEDAGWVGNRGAAGVAMLTKIQAHGMARFTEQYRDDLTQEEVDLLHGAATMTHQWLSDAQGPRALLHGDYRLDNLMFAPDQVIAVDWQTLDAGLPTRDLAYFISTALTPEVRRTHERELVEAYHAQLMAYGVQDYTLEACQTDYRRGMLQAPLIVIIGWSVATSERSAKSDEMFISLARRMCSALKEHDVLELLKYREQK